MKTGEPSISKVENEQLMNSCFFILIDFLFHNIPSLIIQLELVARFSVQFNFFIKKVNIQNAHIIYI